MTARPEASVSTDKGLRDVDREPMPPAAPKEPDHIDIPFRRLIELSPSCVLSSTGLNGHTAEQS